MIIYYNPECSKCNLALGILKKNNCQVEIREYLKIPPSIEELKELIKLLGCKPFDVVRKGEPLFLEKFLGKIISDEEWYFILSNNPILIERPIVIDGDKAIIGRPPELVINLIR